MRGWFFCNPDPEHVEGEGTLWLQPCKLKNDLAANARETRESFFDSCSFASIRGQWVFVVDPSRAFGISGRTRRRLSHRNHHQPRAIRHEQQNCGEEILAYGHVLK